MCSISGFISHKPISAWTAQRLASSLLFYGRDRGEQSAGVWTNGKLYKEAINPAQFIYKPKFAKLFEKETNLVLGHTRQPTCGGRGDDQAQPFENGDIVTIHNGWYSNVPHLKEKWGIVKESGVDSELVASYVAQYGVMQLPEFLESTAGSSAIAVKTPEGLFFATNSNPLAYCSIQLKHNNRILVFASTATILENALQYVWLKDDFKIEVVPDGHLYRVSSKKIKEIKKIKWQRAAYGYNYNNRNRNDEYLNDDMWDRYVDPYNNYDNGMVDREFKGMYAWWNHKLNKWFYEDDQFKLFVEKQDLQGKKELVPYDDDEWAEKRRKKIQEPDVEEQDDVKEHVEGEVVEITKKAQAPGSLESESLGEVKAVEMENSISRAMEENARRGSALSCMSPLVTVKNVTPEQRNNIEIFSKRLEIASTNDRLCSTARNILDTTCDDPDDEYSVTLEQIEQVDLNELEDNRESKIDKLCEVHGEATRDELIGFSDQELDRFICEAFPNGQKDMSEYQTKYCRRRGVDGW